MGGGGGAPEPDPNIGIAALRSAELGEDYLKWMQQQSKMPRRWAVQDRRRHQQTFIPLQDRFIRDAQRWDSPGRQRVAANEAAADVRQQAKIGREMAGRELASMGVNPRSGRYRSLRREAGIDEALAAAGSRNNARRTIRAQGMDMRGQAINLGSGLGINPLSSLQTATQGVASGFQGAMAGRNQQASLLNQQYGNQLQAYQTQQSGRNGLMGSLGMIAGMAFNPEWLSGIPAMAGILSDEKAKTRKRRETGFVKKLEKLPVDRWEYREGMGDGGGKEHVGTYAQHWKKATGTGDGHTIPVGDAIGFTMGAVKEMAAEGKKLQRKVKRMEASMKAAA